MKITSTVSEIVIEWERDQFKLPPRSFAVLKKALAPVKEIQSLKLSGSKQKKIVIIYESPLGVVEFLRKLTRSIRSLQLDRANQEHETNPGEYANSSELIVTSNSIYSRLSRGVYGVLACGSFAMAWVGLILPGIPTVPFVILTVYFAEKVSPTFRKTLMNSPVIGPAMRDWSEHRAIRRSVRKRVYLFVGVMILMALMVTPIDSIQFLSMLVIAALSIYMINRIPVIEDALPHHQTGMLFA